MKFKLLPAAEASRFFPRLCLH